ncbi:unnamed protein product, partial [marine sediment metagenome]
SGWRWNNVHRYVQLLLLQERRGLSSEGGKMKPTRKEFFDAYVTIMAYIDDEPNSRKLFHSLLSFGLGILNQEEEE